jgi:hypothetical protein
VSTVAQLLQSERMKYPGLLPREILVLRSWLRLHEQEYERFDYNVRLGAGFDPGASFPQNIRDMAIANTQKRVDAVAYAASGVTLIEVKDRAGFSAIGQLVGYDAMWRAAFPTSSEPKLMLVCNRTTDDIGLVAARQNIAIQLVEVDFSELAGLRPTRQR